MTSIGEKPYPAKNAKSAALTSDNSDNAVRNTQLSSDMVERVARAIYGIPLRWPEVEDRIRDAYRADARRALEASHHAELVEALRGIQRRVTGIEDSENDTVRLERYAWALTGIALDAKTALAKIGGEA